MKGDERHNTPLIIQAEIQLQSPVEKKEPDSHSAQLEWFKTITELIKSLSWPIVALIVLLTFHGPLARVISLVPQKLEDATKVTIGTLSVEIQQKALMQGQTKVADGFSKLSPGAVARLLRYGKGTTHSVISHNLEGTRLNYPEPMSMKYELELQKVGFLKFSEELG